jgi:glutamyl-tRNA reductase
VTNRTFERAEELAREFNGKPVEFDSFIQELSHTDIVICSTGAPTYILSKEQMHKIMKQRKNRSVFIIDISVPRNIDPEINDIDNIYLYDIDNLQGIVSTNIEERGREAEKAERIVNEEVESFLGWQASLTAVPTIVALREKAESIRNEELQKSLNKLDGLGEKEMKSIEVLTNSIVNKLLHYPTAALKSETEDREIVIDIINRVFHLTAGSQDESESNREQEKQENKNEKQ